MVIPFSGPPKPEACSRVVQVRNRLVFPLGAQHDQDLNP